MRPSHTKWWIALAVVGTAAVSMWMLLGQDAATTLAKPDTGTSEVGARGSIDASGALRMAGDANRRLDVQVEACRGPASDALVFVRVGDDLVSGKTDARGRARFAVAAGRAEVKARVAGYEASMMVGDGGDLVVVKACRGGVVFGRVVTSWGEAIGAGVPVKLVGADGTTIDESATGDDGGYRLIDPELAVARLVVAESDEGGGGLESIALEVEALRPGEERHLDVVIEGALELVGWVLDPAGSPQAGVAISVESEGRSLRWRSVTDKGGGFRFARVPHLPMRVTADGGDLGVTSQRVVPRGESKKDVTMILEPTGTIVVMVAPDVKGEVVVRSYSSAAHGPDAQPHEYYPYAHGAHVEDIEPSLDDFGVGDDPMMKALDETLTETLRDYDPARPVEGVARMVEKLIVKQPLMEELFRMEVEKMMPGSGDKSLPELAKLMAEMAMAEDPSMGEVLAIAADKARNGQSGFAAMMAASNDYSQRNASVEGIHADEATGWDEARAVEVEDGPLMDDPELTMEDANDAMVASVAFHEGLVQRYGDALTDSYRDDSVVVGRGRPNEEIRVRGSMRYQVAVLLPEEGPYGAQYELGCGEVLVPTGKMVEVYCGRASLTTLAGRVIDVNGRPVVEATVEVPRDDGEVETATTDRSGSYSLSFEITRATPCSLTVTHASPGGDWRPSQRVNLACAPAHTVEVDPIVLRRESEAPALRLWEPFGGVGGMLQSGPDGVVLAGLRDDGPLAMDGIEEGSTIIQVDEEEATSWSIEEMLARLRGEVGSDVMLRVRSPGGELVETIIERGLITP